MSTLLAPRSTPVPGLFARTGLILALGCCAALPAVAQMTSANFALTPPLITETSPPNVMLVMSNDHELYKKAYSDYSDVDGDGIIDSEYDDGFTYTGYFDSNFCYTYNNSQFQPVTDISATIGANGHSCIGVSGDWSGNFLNWVSMTRMDIVRHVLFGGRRSTDTAAAGGTVLERVFLPEDVHAYAKVFVGATNRYTPWSQSAISICNMTYGAVGNAPVLRVAFGEWPLWATSEIVQCHYRSEEDSELGNQPENSDRPSAYDYNARVQVCVEGIDNASRRCKPYTHSTTGVVTYKPVGLLQQYGDNSTINFGLITGSYNKKISGGVLRKNIVPLTGNSDNTLNEINLNDGTFSNQGETHAGIINTISRFRITDWDYAANRYSDCDTHSITKATFMTSAASNRQCRNWGNPVSEIYLEALRYFTGDEAAGASAGAGVPTSAFNTSDSDRIASLPQLSWLDPLSPANSCASCSIIVLSSGFSSFDKDELGSVSDLWNVAGTSRMSTSLLNARVDEIGDLEGITGGAFLIGDNGSNSNESCTAKTVSALSKARGICPGVPGLEGGFDIAALAYHAYTKDLRADFDGMQNVTTYSVALAENLPTFELDVNGKRVTFVPLCQANTNGSLKLNESGWTNCSFIDAKIESQTATGGRMYVAWEDSLWGNDYDLDAISRIEWCIGTDTAGCPGEPENADYGSGYGWSDFSWKTSGLTAESIQVRVSAPFAQAGNAIKLGFSITGVEDAASEVYRRTNTAVAAMSSGNLCVNTTTTPHSLTTASCTSAGRKHIARGFQGNGEQAFLLRPGSFNITRLVQNSGNRIIYHEPLVYTASSSVAAGRLLPNPLYFTAKYGSFNDIDGDGTPLYMNDPSDTREWDVRSVDGSNQPDGLPDNFFPITNPGQLSTSLTRIFDIIMARISSGTSSAVVSNSSTGLGAIYQAYYHPQFTDPDNTLLTWGGVLHALFIDDSGRFREDRGIKGTLEDTAIDYVVDIFFDQGVTPNRTRFRRYVQVGSGSSAVLEPLTGPLGGVHDLQDLGSIWNARDVLAGIDQSDLLLQRNIDLMTGQFNQDAASRRYIFTYLDSVTNGTVGAVDGGEVVDFVHDNFDPANGTPNFRYLGLSNPADAENLVRYIRGQDINGWRPRLVDIPGDGTDTPRQWLLGDIVHSSPLVVGAPQESYDLAYGDNTYDAYKQKYQRRREMIYVGGNDGMLHAFNGGVWDAAGRTFQTRNYNSATRTYNVGQSHTLGAEMWAYVPMNLLPHLQWLKENNYPHVYYVDAPPQAFDVNIFPNDAVHPGGWGTILVVGMRLGGGSFPLDLDNDGSSETVMRSAYVVLDITDPDRPPTLIAELTAPDLGFTTSQPTLVKARKPNAFGSYASPSVNHWLLVFGSGPDTLATAVSNGQDAKLFAYDLVSRSMVDIHAAAQTNPADPSGFFGNLRAVDWNNDFVDDVIYAGTVEGSENAPTGRLKRIVLNSSAAHMGLSGGLASMSDVLNVGQPVSATPNVQRSLARNENWILFGTGRLFTIVDNRSTTQQSFYGIKEGAGYDTSSLMVSSLVDTTSILVQTNGNIHHGAAGVQVTRFGTDLDTVTELQGFMDNRPGWVRRLRHSGGSSPSERVFTGSLLRGSTILFTAYTPDIDMCVVEGTSALYALNFRMGTAEAFAPIGADENGFAQAFVDLGQGAAGEPSIHDATGTDPGVNGSNGGTTIRVDQSTGTPVTVPFNPAPVQSGRISWEQLAIPF